MINHLVTFGALTVGIALAVWISLRFLPGSKPNGGDGEDGVSALQLVGRAAVTFFVVLGAFSVLENSIGLSHESRVTPYHAAYSAALIIFLRGMLGRQSNNAQQRTVVDKVQATTQRRAAAKPRH